MKRLCVIGAGYVGLVTGACFADLGNWVTCVDIDRARVNLLNKGTIPFYEPGLAELVKRNLRSKRLSFTNLCAEGVPDADFVFISVNTPSGTEGEADMTDMSSAVESIAECLTRYAIILNKSTVPIGTGDWVANLIQRKNEKALFDVVSNPEFLREGRAVTDFMSPDRIVLGSTKRAAAEQVAALYSTFQCPIIITDLRTAEMIKYASNAFLATRISFINEMAAICDELGADVEEVARGMGLDKRIGSAFLDAGIGYGGSCFPKDVSALAHMASIHGCHPQLLRAVMEINRDQRRMVVQRLRDVVGPLDGLTIGILGLSFKPDTDDMRNAPAVEIIHLLRNERAEVKAYDPAAMERARKLIKGIRFCHDAYAVAEGSDALLVATEWNEFKQLDMARIRSLMRQPVLIDGRNIYDPNEMREQGFVYYGIGRGIPRSSLAKLNGHNQQLGRASE